MKLGCSALAVALAVALSGPVSAQGDENAAANAFDEGASAYSAKEFTRAAKAFERAFRLLPRGISSYNAGLAWQSAGDKARAADAYALGLAQGDLPRANDADARTRLAELEAVLAQIYVRSPVGGRLFVAHVQGATIPTRVHLSPGQHDIRVQRSNGRAEQQRIELVAGQSLDVDFGGDAPVLGRRAIEPPRREPPPSTPADEPGDVRPIVGWALLGASAAAVGAAIVLGATALDARDEYLEDHVYPDGSVDDSESARQDYQDVDRLRLWTNVTWIGAGVLATAGIGVLVWSATSGKPAAANRRSGARFVGGPRGWSLAF
jgi:tetratricopeptide (TPR) repeat protein